MRSAPRRYSLPRRRATTLFQSLSLLQMRILLTPQISAVLLSPRDRYNQVPFHQAAGNAPISSLLLRRLRLAPPTLDHSRPPCPSCLDRIPCSRAWVSRTS